MKESISTKELIRDTLQKLLEEKDYAEISMKEIAKSANVGRRTLYRSEGLKGDDKHLFFVLGEKCGGILLSGSESSFALYRGSSFRVHHAGCVQNKNERCRYGTGADPFRDVKGKII